MLRRRYVQMFKFAHFETDFDVLFPGVWGPPPFWSSDEALSPNYSEGLQVGYRWYEANSVTPVFPFGFGLSYTTFAYSELSVASAVDAQTGRAVLTVTYTITNTGSRQGAEASQVYLTLPAEANQPSKRLVGFQKVDLMPGTSQAVTVTIDSSASNHPLSYWVPENDAPVAGWGVGSWSTPSGDYTVHVGTSSADTPLEQTLSLSFSTSSSPPASPAPPANPVPPAGDDAGSDSGGGGGVLDIVTLLALMSLLAASRRRWHVISQFA